MKVVRRQKGIIIEVNPIEGTAKGTPVYEDVIQESLFKRLIKDKKILIDLFASILLLIGLFFSHNKIAVIFYTLFLYYYFDSLLIGIKYHRQS